MAKAELEVLKEENKRLRETLEIYMGEYREVRIIRVICLDKHCEYWTPILPYQSFYSKNADTTYSMGTCMKGEIVIDGIHHCESYKHE